MLYLGGGKVFKTGQKALNMKETSSKLYSINIKNFSLRSMLRKIKNKL